MSHPSSWTLELTGSTADPESEALIVVRHDPLPQLRLEIHVPELAHLGEREQLAAARAAIQEAATALLEALNSSALPGYVEQHARQI